MTFMDKKEFNISSNDMYKNYESIEKDDVFEVDPLIAPVIRELNRKGYYTDYCCSGHPFGSKYISSSLLVDEYSFPDFKYDTLGDGSYIHITDEKIIECGTDKVGIITGIEKCSSAYICFKKGAGINENILPEGWIADSVSEERFCMRYYFYKEFDEVDFGFGYYDYYDIVIREMKKLYKWALYLPVKENKNKDDNIIKEEN